MSFDKIFDLAAGVYFFFCIVTHKNTISICRSSTRTKKMNKIHVSCEIDLKRFFIKHQPGELRVKGPSRVLLGVYVHVNDTAR